LANVPIGFQHWLNYTTDLSHLVFTSPLDIINTLAASQAKKLVNSPASKQLTIAHYSNTNLTPHPYATLLLSELDNFNTGETVPGYPNFCRRVSVSNGNAQVIPFSGITPGGRIFDMYVGPVNILNNAQPAFLTKKAKCYWLNTGLNKKVFEGQMAVVQYPLFPSPWPKLTIVFGKKSVYINTSDNYDNAPGSFTCIEIIEFGQ